jgi:hypothetical protein
MKSRRSPGAKARRSRGQVVKSLAANGCSGDVIAAKLRLGKDYLRREHALDMAAGREIKRAEREAAKAVTRKERERIEIITATWNSDWREAVFSDCKTLEEALEQSKEHWH